jgi:outer membrane biosynthesis protein TonB
MKKTYKNLIGVALSSILCLSLAVPANAQRGAEHSDGKSTGGGGSTPPPQQSAPPPQVQRSSPPPQQQSAPQQQAPRSYQPPQQQQQQPQQQRSQQPQQQRGSEQAQRQPQQQTNSAGGRTNNAVGSTQDFTPRGEQHREELRFPSSNPNNSNNARRYPGITQRGNSNSYNLVVVHTTRAAAVVLITAVVAAIAAIRAFSLAVITYRQGPAGFTTVTVATIKRTIPRNWALA